MPHGIWSFDHFCVDVLKQLKTYAQSFRIYCTLVQGIKKQEARPTARLGFQH